MNAPACPGPEELALFVTREGSEASWRRVVRHLAHCELCRRQVEILDQLPDAAADLPATVPPPPPASRPRTWQRIAQGVAAAAVIAAAVYFLLARPEPPRPVAETPVPRPPAPPRPSMRVAPVRPAFPEPSSPPPRPETARQEHAPFLPPPKEPDEPREVAPPEPKPPSPILVARVPSGVTQPIEVSVGHGEMARLSEEGASPIRQKATLSASDSVRAPDGGSLVLPDGATLHLARASEVGLSWSQTEACARVELRSGDALLDFGRASGSVCLSYGPEAVLLRDSSGHVWLSRGETELRATWLAGTAAFRTPDGASLQIRARESLVFQPGRDRLEDTANPAAALHPRFPSLQPPPPAEAARRAADLQKVPDPAVLLDALAARSYAFSVVGRQTREGVWMPPNVLQSTLGDFTAVRRASDGGALHVRRGLRGWDDLGPVPPGSRDARFLETVRQAPAPHAAIQGLLPFLRGEPQVRTEQVGERLCWVWELELDPEAIRPPVKALLDAAVQEGRVASPDHVSWDTLRGSLEFASTKTDPRLLRVIDRRRVSYSHKTVGGTDRRGYSLETVYHFHAHGQATLKLPAEMVRDLFPGKK
jgi:hypothetical protein